MEHGVRHLKPLNLRQIAAKIGMHESTVSRVTSNKAMATPRGIFEMKYFFTSAIPASGASLDAHSSEAVRDRIKEFILNESPAEILSDDRIVTLLKADGIDIARRTVAKYREALRIPSSSAACCWHQPRLVTGSGISSSSTRRAASCSGPARQTWT